MHGCRCCFADLSCILGGYLPPLFQRWFGVNLIVSRKMVVTLGAVLMIGPGMIGLFTNPYVAIMLLCIGGFAHRGTVWRTDYALV